MKKKYSKILSLRVLSSLLVLFVAISLVFLIIHVAPGNPAQKYLSPKLSSKLYHEISETYNLNRTIGEQYLTFLGNTFSGNWGVSYNYRKPVISVIGTYLKFTAIFSIISFSLQLIFTFTLVYLVAWYNSTILSKYLTNIMLLIYSVPVFITSAFLIYFFSYKMGMFPSSGLTSFNYQNLDSFQKVWNIVTHLFLPFIASSFISVPVYYKYLSDAVKANSEKIFAKNLQIIGISKKKILLKHIFPNSVNSLISIAGIELGFLLGGSVLIETIFSLPGMGRLVMNAVSTRDYPLVIGCVFIVSTMVLVANLIADIVRIFIDKRLTRGMLS